MRPTLSDRTQSGVYVVVVLAVAWSSAGVADGLLLALSPLLVLGLLLVLTRDASPAGRRLGLRPSGLRWWPVAVVATAGVSLGGYGLLVAVGLAEPRAVDRGTAVDLLVLVLTGTVLAFCEEIGWRGYLQPRVATWAGRRGAHLTVGVVWVVWHLAYITRTDGYHADGNRVVVLTSFSLTVLAFAMLLGELRDRSGSVWPPVVGHMAHNVAFAWLGTSVLRTDRPVLVEEYLAGDTGLLVLAGTLAAVLLLGRARRREPTVTG